MATERKWNFIIFGVGISLFIVGIVVGILWPQISDDIVKQLLELQPSSAIYQFWVNPPMSAYISVYLFNITNWKEFLDDKSVKLNFEEVGPYIYEEVHAKENIQWDDENYLVSFNQSRTWHHVPGLSKDLSLKITNINAIAMTMATMSRAWESKLWQKIMNALLNKYETYFVTATADEWMFEGYEDPILNIFNPLRNVTYIPLPFEKFGWFYGRNASAEFDGVLTMKTGADDLSNLGLVEEWNYEKNTSSFSGVCSLVKGNSGELMPPMKNPQNYLTMFSSDFCSSVTLKYSRNISVEGVDGYEFIGDEITFDNGDIDPNNECFCVDECTPFGARNLTDCRYGAPAFASFPHFYNADPSYYENITGLNPSKDKHNFFVRLQPDLGFPMEVQGKLQLNILMQPFPMQDMFKDTPRFYAPMTWSQQAGKISGDLAIILKIFLAITDIGLGIFYGIAGIGFLMVFIRFMVLIRRRQKKSMMNLN